LTPFDPSGYYLLQSGVIVDTVVWGLAELPGHNDTDTSFAQPELYRRAPSQINSLGRIWSFRTQYEGTSSQYDLGLLVLEGSDEVKLNGVPLQRGIDYTIDYGSGQLKILNEAAKAAGADLDITYESGQVFQLDKKTLLGARAEYELWPESYVGGMVLHLNEKSLDKRVRIGNEPIRNTLYDMNAQFKFKPSFLTRAVDALPLVKTNAASSLVLEGEVAKVYPNPNSLSNDATGDHDGVAFLDDFEGSRRSNPLGLQRRNWTLSSIPLDDQVDSLRGKLRWWNPRTDEQVHVQDVFPEREVNSQVADRLQSLMMEFVPDATDAHPERSWGGVMRYLGQGYEDQTRAQYLEFWIQMPAQPEGKLIIDLGTLSEDALPNELMDTEDDPIDPNQPQDRRVHGNGVLSPGEDRGLDHDDNNDPADSAYWNGLSRPKVPSWDDWNYAVGSSDYNTINGTEGNLNDESGNYPDSEDLNGNGALDLANDYFSYTIELDFNSPYIVGGQDNQKRWRLFRVPLDIDDQEIFKVVGSPSLTNVRWARMWLTGITDSMRIQIVQNDIVSNEWLPEYVDQDSVEFVSVAVINNHENPGYESPPGVSGEIDPITQLRQREQSLVLHINDLQGPVDTSQGPQAIPSEFFVSKNLYQEISLVEYRRLKMFVHGGGIDEGAFPSNGQYQLILRLGQSYSNTEANYYDIVKTIMPGWDSRNAIDLAMNDLSLLKTFREAANSDSTDGTNQNSFTGRFAVQLDSLHPQDSLVINGNPSLQRVGFLALGVRATKGYSKSGDEIWVDELRVSEIYKDPGVAGEFSGTLQMADLLTLNGSWGRKDADFHNVNQRIGSQESTESLRGQVNLKLDKFGLDQHGFSLPVSMNITETDGTPKYIPGTDARVNQSHAPDSVKSHQRTMTYTADYSKTGNSKNPIVRWTAEKLRLSWDHSKTERKDYQTLESNRVQTSASANYSFPTARGRGFAPLWFLKGVPLLSMVGSPRFYFKPSELKAGLSAERGRDYSLTRTGQKRDSQTFGIAETRGISFDITDAIGTGLAQTIGRTLVQVDSVDTLDRNGNPTRTAIARSKQWSDLLGGDMGHANAEAWTWQNNYSPRLAAWFSPSFNYNSSYNWTHQNLSQRTGQNISNSRNVGGDVSLDFKQIFGGGGGRPRGDRERPKPPKPKTGEGEQDSTQTAEPDSLSPEEKKPGFSPLRLFAHALSPVKRAFLVLDPIQLSYDNSNRHQVAAIKGQADLAYRLGFTQTPGVARFDSVTGTAQITESNDYTARSGIRLSQNIRTTLNWNLRNSKSIANTSNGSTDQTYFWLTDNKGIATALPFADVSMDWSGLEKLPFLSKATRSVSLNSGLSSKFKETWNDRASNVTQKDYSRQWNPLIGVNLTWLNDMDTQVRINASNGYTEALATNNRSRTSSQGANATVSYALRTGFRLPIPIIGAMRLENQTTFSLNVDYQNSKSENSTGGGAYVPQNEQVQWSLQPLMNYSFSNTVQGQAKVQYQQTHNKQTDQKSSMFEFGISVQIAIRG
ncbi:cell surface protein SprA, partial [bacterium]|nr:cell surface protein SprA [bacterium]